MLTGFRGRDPRSWEIQAPDSIRQFFTALGKQVVYFAGYGELGYQDEHCVRRVAEQVLANRDLSNVLVHGGTLLRERGHDGIAAIYAIAKELGADTSGIHPSVARRFYTTHRVSPNCDHVFFVQDETWGGLLDGTDTPSPALQLHLDVSDEVVIIGGGKHAADELRAFLGGSREKQVQVQYFPAEMNHAITRKWCERTGVEIHDLRGAAHAAWEQTTPR
jgi:hypothetical protein